MRCRSRALDWDRRGARAASAETRNRGIRSRTVAQRDVVLVDGVPLLYPDLLGPRSWMRGRERAGGRERQRQRRGGRLSARPRHLSPWRARVRMPLTSLCRHELLQVADSIVLVALDAQLLPEPVIQNHLLRAFADCDDDKGVRMRTDDPRMIQSPHAPRRRRRATRVSVPSRPTRPSA